MILINKLPTFFVFSVILVSITACHLFGWGNSSLPIDLSETDLNRVRADVVADIRQELDRQEEAGMYGVFRLQWGDSILIHEAYGWQDREAERAMRRDVGFDIGSIVKLITAATIFKLEEAGQLQTSDPVGRFFPEAPSPIRTIAIAQLLDHTSGLPEYLGGDYELLKRDQALDRIFRSRLRFSPGTGEAYSNTGYTLLGFIIEEASGQAYEQAVRDAVLIPANTPGIGYRLAGWTPNTLAVGYQGRRRWGTPLDHDWLDDGPSWTLRGNGGMLATVDELATWFDALFAGHVLGSVAFTKFSELYVGTDEYGLRIGEAGGNDVFNALHEGWADLGIQLTCMTSVSSRGAERVWNAIHDEMDMLAQVSVQAE